MSTRTHLHKIFHWLIIARSNRKLNFDQSGFEGTDVPIVTSNLIGHYKISIVTPNLIDQ